MDDRNDRDDLAEALRELSATLNALRDELEVDARSRDPRRRQFPLRPPTPGELARFGDEVAIPALIATLEANIRALEALRRGLKIVRGQRAVRDAASGAADRTADRSSELRETTLTHLDRALRELQDAVSGDADEVGIEVDDRTRTLLEDARRLRDDIDKRLAERVDRMEASRSDSESRPYRIDIQSGDNDGNDDQRSARDQDRDSDGGDRLPEESTDSGVDVDAELETLRDRYGASSADGTDESAPTETDGESADDGESRGGDPDETLESSSDEAGANDGSDDGEGNGNDNESNGDGEDKEDDE